MTWHVEVAKQALEIRAALQESHQVPEPFDAYRNLSVVQIERLRKRRDYALVSEFVPSWVGMDGNHP